ncbi:alpha/beta fold hydrolase [Ruegeria halocynthiae]|uniref:alpha/beta fold hydrolase n=1 Tax=Ruegeria halocynthiae TaxID=985054 RepID=UPI0005644F03|nr:alpha/beta hydrolase [Ruegeria halocynthiae]
MTKKILKYAALVIVLAIGGFLYLQYQPELDKDDLAKYTQPPSQFMELEPGTVVHYRDQGNAEGPALVLIHGGTDSLFAWEPWVERLKDDFRLITIDLPGHGLTGRVASEHYTRGNAVKLVHDVLENLDVDKLSIGGHSMGGEIALTYTLENPDKVESMILVGAGGLGGWQEADFLFFPYNLPVIGPYVSYFGDRTSEASTEQTKEYFVGENDDIITEEFMQRWADLLRYEGNRHVNYLMYGDDERSPYGQWYEEIGPEDLEPRLGEITVPSLLLWGKQDVLVPMIAAERFDAGLPNSTLVAYDGVGHMVVDEVTEQSVTDLREFLKANGILRGGDS